MRWPVPRLYKPGGCVSHWWFRPGTEVSGAPCPTPCHERKLLPLVLTALGVVYGDIGTSPLYAMRECFFGSHAVPPTQENVLGVLSLIFWSLLLVISSSTSRS